MSRRSLLLVAVLILGGNAIQAKQSAIATSLAIAPVAQFVQPENLKRQSPDPIREETKEAAAGTPDWTERLELPGRVYRIGK